MDNSWREFNRREFIRIASIATGMFAVPSCSDDDTETPADTHVDPAQDVVADSVLDVADAIDAVDGSAAEVDLTASSALPSLGGAPDTQDGLTMAAFVDTIVPGSHRDPTGAPGALDVGAAAFFFDPDLPAAPLVPVMTLVLDNQAQALHSKIFSELVPSEREEVVTRVLLTATELTYAVLLAKIAFFASEGAAEHLGYPGANLGYYDNENLTFGRAMATEITTDGNYP